jgi:hypothetical protein
VAGGNCYSPTRNGLHHARPDAGLTAAVVRLVAAFGRRCVGLAIAMTLLRSNRLQVGRSVVARETLCSLPAGCLCVGARWVALVPSPFRNHAWPLVTDQTTCIYILLHAFIFLTIFL